MADGIGAVRVERLARVLDVTKGSFYHHFKSRAALLDAMRGAWAEQGTAAIIQQIDAKGGWPAEKLRRLFGLVFAPTDVDALEASMREWAAVDDDTAAVMASTDEQRVAYVADLLKQAGVPAPWSRTRAEVLYRVVVGDFAWRRVQGPRMTDDAIDDLVRQSLRPTSTGLCVRRVPAEEVRPMRAQVLRAHQPYSSTAYAEDDVEGAFHLLATVDGVDAGCCSVFAEAGPEAVEASDDERASSWRMRGVATSPSSRKKGVGRAMMQRLESDVAAAGGTLLWANARSSALPFYRALDYDVVGDAFDIPGIGPHFVIVKRLSTS